jgi:hypothetical protein
MLLVALTNSILLYIIAEVFLFVGAITIIIFAFNPPL